MTAPARGARPSALREVGVPLVAGIVGIEVSIAIGFYALATVLPQVTRSFDADGLYSLASAANLVASVFGFAVAPGWVDRAGPRRPFAVGFAGLVVGQAVCALAPAIGVFIAGRLLVGLGTGLIGVAVYGLISRTVDERHRPFVFGWLNGAWLVPSLAGPAVTGLVAEHVGWRTVFAAVAVLMGLGYALLAWGMAGRPLEPDASAADDGGAAHQGRAAGTPWAWAAGAAVAMLALHLGSESATPGGLALAASGLVLAWAALRRLLPAGTLRGAPGAPRLIALRALLAAATIAAEAYVPFHLQHDRGLSMAASGLVIASTAIGWTPGAALQGAWARRIGAASMLRWCATLALVGPAGLLVCIAVGAHPVLFAACLAGMGFVVGAAYPQISTEAMRHSADSEHAAVGGALQLGEGASGAVTMAGTGLILALAGPGGLPAAYVLLVLVGLGAVVVAQGLADPPRRSVAADPAAG